MLQPHASDGEAGSFSLDDVPAYVGQPSVAVNGDKPFFTEADRARGSAPFESYAELDALGRCGVAFACVGRETMPKEERGSIGMIKPSGWQVSKYDWIDGEYLYNRCHLIAHSLTAENDNDRNLITGTRTMNAVGMLPLEERTVGYINQTGNHVLYRVTPVFEGDDLVARGVLMEAESMEDGGSGLRFCAWCYNVEPGVAIDYATGDNWASDGAGTDGKGAESAAADESAAVADPDGMGAHGGAAGSGFSNESEGSPGSVSSGENRDVREADSAAAAEGSRASDASTNAYTQTYILNTNSFKFHYPTCPSVADMSEKNKREFVGTRDEAIEQGFTPCGWCKP